MGSVTTPCHRPRKMLVRGLIRLVGLLAILAGRPAFADIVFFNWDLNVGPANDANIVIGDTVTWTWTDGLPHDVTSTGNFNSATIAGSGFTFSQTFDSAGSFAYFCGVHGAGSMGGTINVAVPEPSSLLLLGMVALGVVGYRLARGRMSASPFGRV